MKRILVTLLFLCVAVAAWAFNLSQITYLRAELPNGGPIVQITSINQFVQLVESKQERIVYLIGSGTANQMFAFVADGAVYRAAANGFTTLVDARTAMQMGLKTGAELYIARKFGIRDLHSIYYANSEYFTNAQDYRAALQGGFKGSAMEMLTSPMPFWFYAHRPSPGAMLAMPYTVSSSDLKKILLPQIAWYVLVFNPSHPSRSVVRYPRTRKEPTPSNISSLNVAGILKVIGIAPHRDWTRQEYDSAVKKLVANGEFDRWAREKLTMYRRGANGELAAKAQDGIEPNLMTVVDAFGVHITDREALRYRINLERSMGDHTPPPARPMTYFADSMNIIPRFPTDSVIYTMARLFGMKTAAEYLSLNEAAEAGYRTAADEKASQAGGFRYPRDYYAAVRLGATTVTDYNKVVGLPDKLLAKRYLRLLSVLTELKKKYDTKDVNQLTIAYALVNLPRGVPYSATGILENLNVLEGPYVNPTNRNVCYFARAVETVGRPIGRTYETNKTADLSKYSQAVTGQRIETVLNALESLPWIAEIGTYNLQTGVFTRS